ncbi:leucine--tRNA ligase [Sodalis sp. CWE]|uniref:leucine--tRNA ligase n=1 Tax=Sodalis sp. CWE TaxID=2803816 RepID=UPI001C7DD292|nr:leucine--tRNA ligase [Sodalis sp. CWE]MBX4180931.1 leucine--tRNA ligase [Sodalis sp. CWE]
MQEFYCPEKIEPMVQLYWKENNTFKVTEDPSKEKYYCLSMLPYPSGRLHIGHVRNYTISDVIARYQRMLGKNVLHPIGWDAFGLPAERAAIKNNVAPAKWTYANIDYMKKQLKLLGFSYDWSREITTCSPNYYRWEQWFFILLYKKGLAYKKKSVVNWCPQDQTVLANEQVIDGYCWRCNTQVKYKAIPQWFIKITSYADQLLDSLEKLDFWPEKVKTMQRNWIGRSDGVEIILKISNSKEVITAYTARPDAIISATYIILAIDHPLSLKVAKSDQKIADFIQKCQLTKKLSESKTTLIEQKGIATGLYAVHPITNEMLPIWITSFRLANYCKNAIMAIPGFNKIDFKFARKYGLPIKVINHDLYDSELNLSFNLLKKHNTVFQINKLKDNLKVRKTINTIIDTLIAKGSGKRKVSYRLRDWGVSRQRYWGAPIPMITLENGSIVPVPEKQLPVLLPENVLVNGISNPLKSNPNWIKTIYNNRPALRETDTFDTFMESSWYYARYTCPNYDYGMLDPIATNYWLPVDLYVGGIEHATMHLIYFRFYHKLLRDAGLVSNDEPVKRLLCQGMVLSDAFYYFEKKGNPVWISPMNVVSIKRDGKGRIISAIDVNGHKLIYAGMIKMSKSKNNGIDPEQMVKKYGADTVRLFVMFAAPVEMALEWKESGVEGGSRFLNRIWKLVYKHTINGLGGVLNPDLLKDEQKILRREIHKTIAKVTKDIDCLKKFNTAIAAIMELTNKLINAPQTTMQDRALLHEALTAIVLMLYPFTPHICFFLWKALGKKEEIDKAAWPTVDKSAIKDSNKVIIIQINGKFRGKVTVPINADETLVYNRAIQEPIVAKFIKKSKIHKVIYIPNKLFNLVVN